ncbi:LPXTG cell wall anchor domain-containing protein [Fictibacillus sp. KU28468]|uniref:LPXTG cell wall anchor domain-containing protein n=1 Tax=Fictibacillus sp. KU28468 TaxID=2991053 RepID=UPI00223E8815|nr:LPXTG cell wall anchor domain-containing protein [Fictibacillus sp. KU28468]UZJ80078.1 LPXTG cell wall anchor domain-containing protein [Fictibacillus sp. KU28468]
MNYKKLKFMFTLVLLAALSLSFTPLMKTEAEAPPNVIDIDTFPQKHVIDIDQLKPGDRIKDSLEIRNNGNVEFGYNSKAIYKGGSKKYYNQLLLEISDQKSDLLFNGKLKNFKGFKLRKLKQFSKEKLFFIITVPDLDNRYQGMSTTSELLFYVSGDTGNGQIDDKNNPIEKDTNDGILPKTGEEDPLLIYITGLILISVGIVILFMKKSIIPNPFHKDKD